MGAATHAGEDKQTRYAVLLVRQQQAVAFQAFAFETFWGFACGCPGLVAVPPGAFEASHHCTGRYGGVFVLRQMSFINAAAVGLQLTARGVS